MLETVTETATNPTEANTSSQASAETTAPAVATNGTEQQQAETQQTQGKPEGQTQTEEKPAEQAGAPEKYEFSSPEGVVYDTVLLDKFSEAAKSANLTQEAASKVLDTIAPALAQRQTEQIEALKTTWGEASKTDKEIGGEKLQENLGIAKKAADAFGTPELRKLLEDTGLGNHPEVLRLLYRAGKAISEDTFVSGNPSPKTALNPADVLYPTMKKE